MKNLELASPPEMSASARADEIATILAAAIVRTLAADEPKQSEVGLGFLPDQRVHTPPLSRGEVVVVVTRRCTLRVARSEFQL